MFYRKDEVKKMNENLSELSQDELLTVVGGQNIGACTACTISGGMLFSNCVSIGVVVCPPAGIVAGVAGAALLGAGVFFAK